MTSSVGAGRTRALLWALAGLVLLIALIDGASVMIARLQIDEDAKTAGRYATQQIHDAPVNQETARVAYAAATSALPSDAETILVNEAGDAEDFRVNADGSITLTVTRTAPTLAFQYLPKLKDLTVAKVTYTAPKFGM